MRLLILTQAVDRDDPVLGFFHGWIEKFAEKFEQISVICLRKGEVDLPSRVRVASLGKEIGTSRIGYILKFYRSVWALRGEYDAVFVHMNEEYVLLGAALWKFLGKRVYLWRNHYAGSLRTDIAAALSTKVFCTSRFSYTAKYKKTVRMPVGVDTDLFTPVREVERIPRSILFLGRLAPSKRPDLLIEALAILKERGADFSATFCGPSDEKYRETLEQKVKEQALANILFKSGVPNRDTPGIYSAHEVVVNVSPSGMYDKTIFEAFATETLVVTSNRNLADVLERELVFRENDAEELARALVYVSALTKEKRTALSSSMRNYVLREHSLDVLAARLLNETKI